MKNNFIQVITSTGVAVFSYIVAALFGAWNSVLSTLLIFMIIDVVCGTLSGVLHKSCKTEDGRLKSSVFKKGIVKKCGMMLLIVIAHRIDLITGLGIVVDGTAIALIIGEVLSIIENIGLIGVPIPNILKSAISLLSVELEKIEKQEDQSDEQTKDN